MKKLLLCLILLFLGLSGVQAQHWHRGWGGGRHWGHGHGWHGNRGWYGWNRGWYGGGWNGGYWRGGSVIIGPAYYPGYYGYYPSYYGYGGGGYYPSCGYGSYGYGY